MPDTLDLVYLALYLFIWTALYSGCFSLAACALRSHALGCQSLSEDERAALRAQAMQDARDRRRREAEERATYRI